MVPLQKQVDLLYPSMQDGYRLAEALVKVYTETVTLRRTLYEHEQAVADIWKQTVGLPDVWQGMLMGIDRFGVTYLVLSTEEVYWVGNESVLAKNCSAEQIAKAYRTSRWYVNLDGSLGKRFNDWSPIPGQCPACRITKGGSV